MDWGRDVGRLKLDEYKEEVFHQMRSWIAGYLATTKIENQLALGDAVAAQVHLTTVRWLLRSFGGRCLDRVR